MRIESINTSAIQDIFAGGGEPSSVALRLVEFVLAFMYCSWEDSRLARHARKSSFVFYCRSILLTQGSTNWLGQLMERAQVCDPYTTVQLLLFLTHCHQRPPKTEIHKVKRNRRLINVSFYEAANVCDFRTLNLLPSSRQARLCA